MTVDLNAMTIAQLEELREQAAEMIVRKSQEEKEQLLADMKKLADERGYDFDEVVGGKPKERKRAAPKYQNPDNLKQTWSGKGRKPQWVEDLLATGKTLAEIEIK